MANYVLEILDGDRAGEVLAVTNAPIRIGRKPSNDLVIADEKTSGVHAEVVAEGDRHVLRDLGSTNGTFLDGKRVSEIVLTPGDEVTIGRVRVRFREAGAAAPVDAGDLTLRRLDTGRASRRGGVGLMAGVLVLALGGAGWFWWQGQQQQQQSNDGPRQRSPLVVADNKLAGAVAACDGEDGWVLRAAGGGFQTTTAAHTGAGAFQAQRDGAADAASFAVLRLADAVSVFANRTLTVAAHLRASGGASVAVRAVAFASNEAVPFRFCTGTALASPADWQRHEVVVPIPVGCDRLLVEVIAVLPSADALAGVDDVAVTESGQGAPLEAKLPESSQTALGSGAAFAVRSTDADNPATLLAVRPGVVPEPLRGLDEAGATVLSDLGATLTCTAGERSFELAAKGVDSLRFVFPADAAGGLLCRRGDTGFASTSADVAFTADEVLLGDRGTRALLRLGGAVACTGKLGSGRYELTVATNKVELVLGFRAERQRANEMLLRARADDRDGRYGRALDSLRELATQAPMDSELLGQAGVLRATILQRQADTVAQFQRDLDEAMFFRTRGGFERVLAGVDELGAVYGADNLEDKAAIERLRASAESRLQALDAEHAGAQRARLAALAEALAGGRQEGLATLVKDYVARHLPAPPTAPGGGAGSDTPR
ncbi:MAG: FHA domain-containing protein [Planctomycetes bacterium]|nr:FHA domain-containing protein [Planctomycetota bacterium]